MPDCGSVNETVTLSPSIGQARFNGWLGGPGFDKDAQAFKSRFFHVIDADRHQRSESSSSRNPAMIRLEEASIPVT